VATAALAGAGAALAPILGALSNQQRATGPGSRPQVESALPAMAAADKRKLKTLQAEADKERLYNLLTQPEVMGLLITLGGITASNRMSFASDRERNLALQSIATTASVLLGLGYAGVGDLTTLIIALGAGGGSLIGSLINLPDIDIPGLDLLGSGGNGNGSIWGDVLKYAPGGGLISDIFDL